MKKTRKFIKLSIDEKEILENFYNRLKQVLTETHNYSPREVDLETYRFILQNTEKPVKDYIKIFYCIPKKAQRKILRHLRHKSDVDFRKWIRKNVIRYYQDKKRLEDKTRKI